MDDGDIGLERRTGAGRRQARLAPAGSRATLRDVATEAGVHISTVSRVLNGRASEGRITPETEERVRAAAARLGYRRNSIARALRTGRTLVVGMLVPDIANLYVAGITRGAEDVLSEHGYSLLLASTDDNLARARSHVSAMLSAQTEGLLYGVARAEDPVLAGIVETGTPVVLFNRTTGVDGVSAMLIDDSAGISQAVDHLVGLGHRRIVHLAGPTDVSSSMNRRTAFDDALAARGLAGRSMAARRHTEEEGERVAGALLDADPSLTAIIAANDRLALGAIDAIRVRGMRCPEDVSVVGFNDMPYASRFSPPLTTLHVSQDGLGRRAAALLLEAIADPEQPPRTEQVVPELVVRGSTAVAPGG